MSSAASSTVLTNPNFPSSVVTATPYQSNNTNEVGSLSLFREITFDSNLNVSTRDLDMHSEIPERKVMKIKPGMKYRVGDILLPISNNNDDGDTQSCIHLAFRCNACAWCNKPKNECENHQTTTLPFCYIANNLYLTLEAIRYVRDRDLQGLLSRKKLHLALDLDHTLIHSKAACTLTQEEQQKVNSNINGSDLYKIADGYKGNKLVKLRPGVREFLKQASRMFDLSVYTMAARPYAMQVVRLLKTTVGGTVFRFPRIISREHNTTLGRKGLDVVLSHERVVLIVDDLQRVWCDDNKGNVIEIKPYLFFSDVKYTKRNNNGNYSKKFSIEDGDYQELARVLGVLESVHTMFYDDEDGNDCASKDVRQLLQKVQNQSIDEASSDLTTENV